MKIHGEKGRILGKRSLMIYGQFLEHFHRQIYGGIYDPGNPLSDEDGIRRDVLEALKKIRVPVIRWPGGCFVSSYHWMDGVGKERTPCFDKAWRVEEPNTFGTDEYVSFCRKLGCEPYICTNAGTGTAEEMSDWVEYCNLETEGKYAAMRIRNGHPEPHRVKYWSIGNENYGFWEIGAKSAEEWGRLTAEAAKMIKHVDPTVELTAAALVDLDWNVNLLKNCGQFLDWISIHEYWDPIHETNAYADYEECMAYTADLDHSVRKVRGLLEAMGLEKKIRIAYDEWNLRQWYHPGVHSVEQAVEKAAYIDPRDENDDNTRYTMADAVFTACFLNMCLRNCDLVGMANFAPAVNTRGCIYTYSDGIVLRSTYHVFDLYVNYMGDIVQDSWQEHVPEKIFRDFSGNDKKAELVDVVATTFSDGEGWAIAAVNKDPKQERELTLDIEAEGEIHCFSICGESTESYNDVGRQEVTVEKSSHGAYQRGATITLKLHSVTVIQVGVTGHS